MPNERNSADRSELGGIKVADTPGDVSTIAKGQRSPSVPIAVTGSV